MKYTLEQSKENLRLALERLERAVGASGAEMKKVRSNLEQLKSKQQLQQSLSFDGEEVGKKADNVEAIRLSLKDLKKLVGE